MLTRMNNNKLRESCRVLADTVLARIPHFTSSRRPSAVSHTKASQVFPQRMEGMRGAHLEVPVLALEDAGLPIFEREVDPLACQVLGLDLDGNRPLQAMQV